MCTSPIVIKYQSIEGNHAKLVPCGKCFECLKQKQNDYFVRIYEELTQSSKACMVTLTYAPQNVPYFLIDGKKFLTVWKDDVKSWMKRFRTNYERATGDKIGRFFLCSEYGEHTHRPHYHCLFFNMSVKDVSLALNDWRKRFGYVMAKDIDFSSSKSLECSARYVSKYCVKGVFENPFRWKSESRTVFSPVLQEFRHNVCVPFSSFPPLFYMSNFIALPSWDSLDVKGPLSRELAYQKYMLRTFYYDLLGRGVEKEECTDR